MDNIIKTGKEIVDEFFNTIEQIPEADHKIASKLKELYFQNKLTETNLSNALFKQREDSKNDKD